MGAGQQLEFAELTTPRMLFANCGGDDLDALSGYLSTAGFEVVNVASAEEALANLTVHGADLALVDLRLPERDGLDLLAAIRHSESWRDLPIIVLSSLDRAHLKIRALEAGADDCVVRPVHPAELQARVRALLRRATAGAVPRNYLRGDLAEMPLSLLLQTLAYAGRTATIVLPERRRRATLDAANPLRSLGAWGAVALREGAFVAAWYRAHRDFEALVRLALCRAGRFETRFDEVLLPDDQEQRSAPPTAVDGLMLRVMVAIDDALSQLASLADLDQPLALTTPTGEPRSQLSARSFLLAWPGPFSQGATELAATLTSRRLGTAAAVD